MLELGNEYRIQECKITKEGSRDLDLQGAGMISSLEFYEDMFHNTISGSIALADDRFDLVGRYPIIGNENARIRLSSSKDSSNYEIDFNIFSIGNVEFPNSTSKTYSIRLVSNEYLSNLKTLVSRSYKDYLLSEIAEKVLNDYLPSSRSKDYHLEDTKERHHIIIPNWNPFDALNWLSKRSVSVHNNSTGFVFYESRSGFHYKSYESLMQQVPVAKYAYSSLSLDSDSQIQSTNKSDDSEKIININVVKVPNVINNIQKGMYSNRIISHDWINQNYESREFDYDDEFDFNTNLNGTKLGEHSGVSNEKVIYENYDSQPTENLNGVATRISRIQQMENFRINVTTAGNIDRQIGDVITIEILSVDMRTEEKLLDETFSGNWLVTGIRHSISDKHITMMELIKDTYGNIEG